MKFDQTNKLIGLSFRILHYTESIGAVTGSTCGLFTELQVIIIFKCVYIDIKQVHVSIVAG